MSWRKNFKELKENTVDGMYSDEELEIFAKRERARERKLAEEKEAKDATLRDQFAMAALSGVIAKSRGFNGSAFSSEYEEYVCEAYKYADTMLKQREEAP